MAAMHDELVLPGVLDEAGVDELAHHVGGESAGLGIFGQLHHLLLESVDLGILGLLLGLRAQPQRKRVALGARGGVRLGGERAVRTLA